MIVLQLRHADLAPQVDLPDDRREHGLLVIDVIHQGAVQDSSALAQSLEPLDVTRSDGRRQPVDICDERSQPGMLRENARTNVAHP
jgi:hypothetical protein